MNPATKAMKQTAQNLNKSHAVNVSTDKEYSACQ